IASAGVLRCFRLENGGLEWETYLGRADSPWRVVRSGNYLITAPTRAGTDGRTPVILSELENGAAVQRLHFHSPPGSVRVWTGPETTWIAVADRLVGVGK